MFIDESASIGYSNALKCYLLSDIAYQDELVFRNSYCFLGDLISKKIVTNYDLYVLGDCNVEQIEVKRNLYVLGNLITNNIKVSGELKVFGNLKANKISISESLYTKDFDIETGSIGSRCIVDGFLIVTKNISIKDMLIIGEDIIGEGTIDAKRIINNNESSITYEKTGHINEIDFGEQEFIDYYKKLEKDIENEINNIIIESSDDYEIILEHLNLIRKVHSKSTNLYKYYKKIIKYEYKNKLSTLNEFVELLYLKKKVPKILSNIQNVKDVINDFYNRERAKIKQMGLDENRRKNIVALYRLEMTKDLLSENEYTFIYSNLIESLYNKEVSKSGSSL